LLWTFSSKSKDFLLHLVVSIGISPFYVLLALALGYLAFINNFHFDLSQVLLFIRYFCTIAEMTGQNWRNFLLLFKTSSLNYFYIDL
jgi:hypothetical protein